MKWFDRILTIASIAVGLGGGAYIVNYWSSLVKMFQEYTSQATLLVVVSFALGAVVAMWVRKAACLIRAWIVERRTETAEKVRYRDGSYVARHAATSETSNDSYSYDMLSPAEAEVVDRIYERSQLHVGTEFLEIGRTLRRMGVVFRTDAPSSDLIEECDMTLTDRWRAIMNERSRSKSGGPHI